MIREIYFLEEVRSGRKILVYEDATPIDARADRRAQQQKMVQLGFHHLLGEEEIRVGHEPSGAPFLIDHPALHISISHTHDVYALCMHPFHNVGVDVQRKRANGFPSALHYFLSEEEMSIPHTEHELYLLWCAKEALYKRVKGALANYREDMQIDAISSDFLLGKVEDEYVRCSHLLLGEDLVLVYC